MLVFKKALQGAHNISINVVILQNVIIFIPRPGHDSVGKIHVKQIYEIALVKKKLDEHLEGISVECLCKCIAGSARSMGIAVVSEDS